MSVDGGCRRNGYSDAVAAGAVIVHLKWGRWKSYTRRLPDYPTPTSQAAELTAVIMALEQALEQYQSMYASPSTRVTIMTDSKYAHGCMTEWRYKWVENGWLNCNGNDVANRDLVERALDLEAEVEQHGNVQYTWVPREENQQADAAVSKELNNMNGNEYSSPEG
ncbi:MAG: hypothetical protein LQ338_004962 [Usnochroma carphineum]|nr:MAG: hypothetical protein LQ338_004962 [Usnochroma carphineum]